MRATGLKLSYRIEHKPFTAENGEIPKTQFPSLINVIFAGQTDPALQAIVVSNHVHRSTV